MKNLWNLDDLRGNPDIVVPGETIPQIFWNAVQLRQSQIWLRQKELGIWRSWTWAEVANEVTAIGHGLLSLGLEPKECVSILSNTNANWVLTDLAILCSGGVCSGIYPTDAAEQVAYLCADSDTRVLFVEDDEQLDKAFEARSSLPNLRQIVVFDMKGLRHLEDPQVISLEQLKARGRAHQAAHAGLLQARSEAVTPEDLAILVYTSGTTGKPKGAMHVHAGLVFTIRGYNAVLASSDTDEKMCFLPLCHIVERMGGEYNSLYTGARLNFVENPDTVPENVREIAPTQLAAVPRVWEKFYSAITIAIKESTLIQQLAYSWAINVGRTVTEQVLAGRPVAWHLKLRFIAARLLVLNNIRKLIGINRCRFIASGAAPISPELIRWYMALGIPMFEAWGMTETCGLSTANSSIGFKPGTIGRPAEYNEVRIDPDTNEIRVRGKNVFRGYLNQPEKTAETIDADGWLHTGDIGAIDADGFFRITDRMKDIIITAGGKNVTPSEWENELKFSPYVTDAVIVGDQKPYLVCLIMIDLDTVEKFAQDNDIPFSNYASLTRAEEVRKLIQVEVDKVNSKFARVEQIKKFFLIDVQLTAEDEELTPTMKLKRKLVERKYAAQIEAMYE